MSVADRETQTVTRRDTAVAGHSTVKFTPSAELAVELETRMPRWLVADLRSDHAGETGAVAIYHGVLAASRDERVRDFAREHQTTEVRHLALMNAVLPRRNRSVFTPLWWVAGWMTGAVPALFGRKAVFHTIDAVETFVDSHYAEQIDRLETDGRFPALRAALEQCRLDEVAHRDDARSRADERPGVIILAWQAVVGFGSASAVSVARLF